MSALRVAISARFFATSAEKIVAGECDELPEAAFYMVGTIEEAMEKAQKMAAEAT